MTVVVTGDNISKLANRRIDVLARRKQHDQSEITNNPITRRDPRPN
jgi:hypothetical protein